MSGQEPRKTRDALQACAKTGCAATLVPARARLTFFRVHSRVSRFLFPFLFAVPYASAQAPLLQDGAETLRQARLDWTLGQAPLAPSSLPSFEVGWGGAGSEGAYAPLTDGEGLGHGTRGWGLGLQGRYVRGGWSFSTTLLALRDRGRTLGTLQRAAVAYQTESGWRVALEQTPFAWGSGLNGGDLLGDGFRPFPRLSMATPDADLFLGRWHMEAFAGRLERTPTIPDWIANRDARTAAHSAGLDLQNPLLWGGWLGVSFGSLVETRLGAVTMGGGQDALGRSAPREAARTQSLAEARVRIPWLARWVRARGASVFISQGGMPENRSVTLSPARQLGGLQVVWDGWDLGLEYASAASVQASGPFTQPAYLAGFSSHGDPLGAAFGPGAITRTVDLGLPLFWEGHGRLKAVSITTAQGHPFVGRAWFLQGDVQWRTPTGRIGASLASRQEMPADSPTHWGWSFSVFQALRVF